MDCNEAAILTLLKKSVRILRVRQNERDVWIVAAGDRGREELMRNEEERTR